jgi:hypothetical protein
MHIPHALQQGAVNSLIEIYASLFGTRQLWFGDQHVVGSKPERHATELK